MNSIIIPHYLNNFRKDLKIKKALAANNLGSERSISESLALINQHVTSLGEVNHLAAEPIVGVLAPPPGFSNPKFYSGN